ncbi:hypothetical protein F0562_005719 [Nyssa sinensis]|uniref:Alcohol dehydrogenase-like N-terminal domain-containing protein n=1 Tax=Nyssa sinensis TaxID=561372 RepID=A0A5J5API1_9ASTE|nr:hypothetical protein F0562_005719 [Nyssa sinensis]
MWQVVDSSDDVAANVVNDVSGSGPQWTPGDDVAVDVVADVTADEPDDVADSGPRVMTGLMMWQVVDPGDDVSVDVANDVVGSGPKHEIVGVVTKIGENVKKFKVGDRVEVAVIVGSYKTCEACQQDLESYCTKKIFTYGSTYHDGTKTYGGYSDVVVSDQRYMLRFPDNLPSDLGAPLLCAGITVYSAMKYYGMTEPGKHLGMVGLGGLGHVVVKFGKAFGLKNESLLGEVTLEGIKETQEMLDFCAKHNITSDIELIRMDYINTVMDRLAKSDVRYRFVIDVANSLSQ